MSESFDKSRFGAHPSPFIEGTNVQFAWDSVSRGLLKACPRKYYYTMIEGWRQKSESIHLDFGIYYHSALETYDKAVVQGASHEEALELAVRRAMEDSWIGREEDGSGGKPWAADNGKKNRHNLIRTIVWYLEEFKNNPLKTMVKPDGTAAVELSFRFEVPGPENINYLLCGHLDKGVLYDDMPFILDRKTTSGSISNFYMEGFNPDDQMSGYTFAGKIVLGSPVKGVIIDAAQVLVGHSAFSRGMTMRTESQLEEWLDMTIQWFNFALIYAESNSWPMNETSCGNYGGCAFRDVCKTSPSVRDNYLRTNFERKFWNPLESR